VTPTRAAARLAAALVVAGAVGPAAVATGTIRTVTTTADSATSPPPGSLRHIIENVAQPGDTIVFDGTLSITVDTVYRIEIPPGLTGLTIQGPAELRKGVLVVRGDGTTIDGMRFTDCRVFAGTQESLDDDSRTDDFVFRNNTLVNAAGLHLTLAADALIEDNVFDVRSAFGDNAIGDYGSDRSRWTGNTWPEASQGGFAEANGDGLVFDGGNSVSGNAIFAPRSGRIADVTVTGHLRVYRSDQEMTGPVEIEGVTCATLSAHRPDLVVAGNTVTGSPPEGGKSVKIVTATREPTGEVEYRKIREMRVTPFSVGTDGFSGDGGTLEVTGNTVDATDGWLSGFHVRTMPATTSCTVEGNSLEGGKVTGMNVTAASAATVSGNTVLGGGKKGSLVLAGDGGEGLTVEGNEVRDGLGAGILVEAGTGPAALAGNVVEDCAGAGLQVVGRPLESEDGTYSGNGTGVRIGKSTVAAIRGGTVAGNRGAGLLADPLAAVEIARVVFGGNAKAGIDLAPGGVSVNAKKKTANGNMPYPETLEYDSSLGKAKGIAEPFARIDAYAVEEGPRAGNPKNGEGVAWLGEVVAGADGRFTFPAEGRLACPPSHLVTFTATRQGEGIDPVTSEFSLDLDCAGAPLLMLSRAPDGTPGNDQTSGSGSTLDERHRTVSEDGRWVVFHSEATNLVEGDTNGLIDVFLRDTAGGTTIRVSRALDGGQVERESGYDAGSSPSISADGRWIAYTTTAMAPFTGVAWYYNDPGVLLFDRETSTTTIVASPMQLEEPLPSGSYSYGGAYHASVSGDGSAVIFSARGPDYVSGDAGDDVDFFVWTRAGGTYERVSVPTGGGDVTNGWQAAFGEDPRLSHDARFATFTSAADLSGASLPYGSRVWLRDRQAGTTELVSRTSAGAAGQGHDAWTSDDGRFVAFSSYEALVPADANGATDVYLRDRQEGTTTLVSATPEGAAMYGDSWEPSITGDGVRVAFRNFGNLWIYYRVAGTRTNVSMTGGVNPNVGLKSPRLSRTGRFLQFFTAATNLVDLGGQTFVDHLYLRDLEADGE
jgi:Tol biopolymer transport system component